MTVKYKLNRYFEHLFYTCFQNEIDLCTGMERYEYRGWRWHIWVAEMKFYHRLGNFWFFLWHLTFTGKKAT